MKRVLLLALVFVVGCHSYPGANEINGVIFAPT
jgi:hypothetical protein